jgi:uncharacterized protein YycO
MQIKLIPKILLSSGLLTIFFALTFIYQTLSLKSNFSHGSPEFIFTNQIELQNGDLIFRRGRSIESQIVLLTDRNSKYSHVGIIYLKDKKPFVVHSVPSENGTEYELIKMERVEKFLSEDKAAQFAVFRLEDSLMNTTRVASEFAYNYYLNKFRFDNQYDLNSDTKLYCTELIWKAYKNAGVDLVQNRLHDINFIVINKKMIMPSSIIKSRLLQKVYSN